MVRFAYVGKGFKKRLMVKGRGVRAPYEEEGEIWEAGRQRGWLHGIQKHRMGIAIGSTGWALLFFYLAYEYAEYGSLAGLLAHVGNPNPIPISFHVMMFLAPVISMFFGYLTEKKTALEHEVKETKEFLHSIIDSSADAIVTTNAEGIVTTWSRGAEDLYGYKAEDVLGRPVTGIYPEELKKDRRKWQKTVTEGKTLRNIPTKIYNRDGRLVDISLSLAPLKDENGEVIGTVDVSKDVTEHRQIEEQIETEKNKLENIVKGIGGGLSLLDSETRVLWANEVLQDWFGPIEKIKGKLCYELYELKDPDEECVALRALSSGETEHGGAFAKDIKGKKRYFQLTAAPIKDKAGKTVQIVELTQDVTERREAEEKLREKMDELEKWQKYTVGREVRMVELKKKIKELEAEIEKLRRKG